MNYLFIATLAITIILICIYWYASYAARTGFAVDENKNNIPDKWEKFQILFKLKTVIILILGFILGYLFHFVSL